MVCVKKSFNCSGSSILESVIALSIISICLFITLMVYTSVFSVKSSAKFYTGQLRHETYFYYKLLQSDTLNASSFDIVNEETINIKLHIKKITLVFQDSLKNKTTTSYFLPVSDE